MSVPVFAQSCVHASKPAAFVGRPTLELHRLSASPVPSLLYIILARCFEENGPVDAKSAELRGSYRRGEGEH